MLSIPSDSFVGFVFAYLKHLKRKEVQVSTSAHQEIVTCPSLALQMGWCGGLASFLPTPILSISHPKAFLGMLDRPGEWLAVSIAAPWESALELGSPGGGTRGQGSGVKHTWVSWDKVSPSASLGEAWGVRSDGLAQSLSWASLGLGPRTGKADEMDMANAEGF